jgi:hypothetical protein
VCATFKGVYTFKAVLEPGGRDTAVFQTQRERRLPSCPHHQINHKDIKIHFSPHQHYALQTSQCVPSQYYVCLSTCLNPHLVPHFTNARLRSCPSPPSHTAYNPQNLAPYDPQNDVVCPPPLSILHTTQCSPINSCSASLAG